MAEPNGDGDGLEEASRMLDDLEAIKTGFDRVYRTMAEQHKRLSLSYEKKLKECRVLCESLKRELKTVKERKCQK